MAAGADRLSALHVLESWPPVVSGYATRSRELLLAQAAAPGLEPHALVTSRQATYGAPGVDVPAPLAGRVRLLAPSPREARLRRVRAFHLDARRLTRAVAHAAGEAGADLVHVHWSSRIGAAAAAGARSVGLPLVAEVRFDLAGAVMAETVRLPVPGLERTLRARFEAHLAAADAVVAASDALAELLRRERPDVAPRLRVVPNGVDAARFAPGPPGPWRAPGPERLLVGSTAKMLRYEGLDRLVRAAAALRRRGVAVEVLLVGDGPQRGALERLAARLSAPVRFAGAVPAADVPGVLRALDVFVVPRRDTAVTRFAGPVKLLEAMACGVACVGSAVGEIGPLLAGGRGTALPPGDDAALVEALATLAGDPARRAQLGTAAREHVLARHGWTATAEAARAVYAAVARS